MDINLLKQQLKRELDRRQADSEILDSILAHHGEKAHVYARVATGLYEQFIEMVIQLERLGMNPMMGALQENACMKITAFTLKQIDHGVPADKEDDFFKLIGRITHARHDHLISVYGSKENEE